MCVLRQKQIGKAYNGQEITRVDSDEYFHHKDIGYSRAQLGWLIHGVSWTMHSDWCSVQQTVLRVIYCLYGQTRQTLQTMKPVNQSELSRDCDNTLNRLHTLQDFIIFSVVMLFCRPTASCECVLFHVKVKGVCDLQPGSVLTPPYWGRGAVEESRVAEGGQSPENSLCHRFKYAVFDTKPTYNH